MLAGRRPESRLDRQHKRKADQCHHGIGNETVGVVAKRVNKGAQYWRAGGETEVNRHRDNTDRHAKITRTEVVFGQYRRFHDQAAMRDTKHHHKQEQRNPSRHRQRQ